MNEGKIIEYIDQGKFNCTVCLQDKGNRMQVLSPTNREVNFSPKRALIISKATLNVLSPREDLLRVLKETEALRRDLQKKVRVMELWELIRDESESFDYRYLAQLCFGEMITDDHISALVRALFEDKLYFKMKDGRFVPNAAERVEQILQEKEQEASREEWLRSSSNWIKDVLQGKKVAGPSFKEEVIELLINLALYGDEAPNFKQGKEMLARAGVSDIQQTRKILISLGIWEEDEHLDLIRFDIRSAFNEEDLREAERLAISKTAKNNREDLTDLPVFTIDGPFTQDFDDALSLEIVNDTLQLGVHIADVACIIAPECPLDREASRRGVSLYFPQRQIPMLPPSLSQEALSLIKNHERPAISLLAKFGQGGELLNQRFVLSVIKVQKHFTYEEADRCYRDDEKLKRLFDLSQRLRQQRIDEGSLILSFPEPSVSVLANGAVSIEMIDQDTPSRMIVAEMMILYNWLAARFCKDHDIPIIYRGQDEPNERLSAEGMDFLSYVFKQRRKLNRLIIGPEPMKHTGLGLDVYTNVSSPIRRYFDLLVQRQIHHFLSHGAPLYNREVLDTTRSYVEPLLRDLEKIKRNRTRYWIQKYLSQHMGEVFSALVLDCLKGRYRILLTDFLLPAEIKKQNGQQLYEGERIKVRVKRSDPWNDILALEYVREQDPPS